MDNRILYKCTKCKYCGEVFVDFTNRNACLKCIQDKVKKEIDTINSQKYMVYSDVCICPECGKIFNHMFQDMQCPDCFLHTYLGLEPANPVDCSNSYYMSNPVYHQVCPTCYVYFTSFIPDTQCGSCIAKS